MVTDRDFGGRERRPLSNVKMKKNQLLPGLIRNEKEKLFYTHAHAQMGFQ